MLSKEAAQNLLLWGSYKRMRCSSACSNCAAVLYLSGYQYCNIMLEGHVAAAPSHGNSRGKFQQHLATGTAGAGDRSSRHMHLEEGGAMKGLRVIDVPCREGDEAQGQRN